MIVVVGYTPSEGEPNIPITVEVELQPDDSDAASFGHRMPMEDMKLRLVLGRTAVKTTIMRLLPRGGLEDEVGINKGVLRLRLHGSAPLQSETYFPGACVPVTIQAMDGKAGVIESFTFGSFTYWTANTVMPSSTIETSFPDHQVAA